MTKLSSCIRAVVRDETGGRRDDRGITLVETLTALLITSIVMVTVLPVFSSVSSSNSYAGSIDSASAQGNLGLQNLALQVQSASEICLPTQMTTTGPTVASGFAVRVLTDTFGKQQWDQWMLNTSTHVLEEQQWSPTWTTGQTVPAWTPVATDVVNGSVAPFALPTLTTGLPQSLDVTLYLGTGSSSTTQPAVSQSTVAALDTPYAPSSPAQPSATTED